MPALVVSPYARRADASHALYDHTSFFTSLTELWPLDPSGTDRSACAGRMRPRSGTRSTSRSNHGRAVRIPAIRSPTSTGPRRPRTPNSPLGKFEALLERIFVLPELKTLDRRADVFDTLGKMEDNVVTVKRMQDYESGAKSGA